MTLTAQQHSMAFAEAMRAGTLLNTGFNQNFPYDQITTDSAIGTTGVGNAVAIPLHGGDVVTKASIFVGATAGATMTHKWLALYSSAVIPLLLGQSADDTGTSMAANTIYTQSFTAAITIPSDGLYFLAFCPTGTTIPTLLGKLNFTVAAQQTALDVLVGIGTSSCTFTGAASTAPATITGITNVLTVPWVFVQ